MQNNYMRERAQTLRVLQARPTLKDVLAQVLQDYPSQRAFAERYQVSQQAISLWLAGKRMPRWQTLQQIIYDHPQHGLRFMQALGYRKPYVPPSDLDKYR